MTLAVMVAIAVVAVAIPTCAMIGCNMEMCGGMMPFSTHSGPTFGADCGGSWLLTNSQAGVVPTNSFSSIAALLAALSVAVLLFSPKLASRPIYIAEANAPPPPIEPRGERFTV